MQKILFSLFLVTVLLIPTTVLAQDMELNGDQPADPSLNQSINANQVVAKVNGEKITSQELAQKANVNQMLQQVSQVDQQLVQILAGSEAGKKVLEEYQKAKLDNLINNLLLEQKAESEGIKLTQSEKDKIYKQQKSAILEQNQMSEKEFLSVLEKQGFENEEAYKKQFISNPQIKVNKLIEDEVLTDIEVSESELKEAYNKNKDAFQQSGEDASFKKLKPRLEQMLKQQKQSQAINKYLDKLRKDAEITKNI